MGRTQGSRSLIARCKGSALLLVPDLPKQVLIQVPADRSGPARTTAPHRARGAAPPRTKGYLSSVPAAGVTGRLRVPPPPTGALGLRRELPDTRFHRTNLLPARRVQTSRSAHPRVPLVTAELADWLFPKQQRQPRCACALVLLFVGGFFGRIKLD